MQYSTEKLMKLHDKQRNDSLARFYVVMTIIVSAFIILAMLIKSSEAVEKPVVEKCDDPEKLPDDLRKAYYELKKAGYPVKIQCYKTKEIKKP